MVIYSDVFGRLGRVVAFFNANLTRQTQVLTEADGLLDLFEDRRDLVKGAQADFEGFAAAVAGWSARAKGYADAVLGDLQAELNAPSASPSAILPLLAERMVDDGESVTACGISAPAVTPDAGNTGTGVLVASVLTGDGAADERVVDEALTATCTADAGTGATAGGEPFSLVGYPRPDPAAAKQRGSGAAALATADAASLLGTAGTFESFAAGVPAGWSVTAGTAGTHTVAETIVVHRGAGALKLSGTGSPATVTLTYAFAAGTLRPRTLYCLSAWLRKGGTVTAGSTFQVAVKGTGYAAADAFNADPSGLTTSYAHKSVFFATPAAIPADFRVELTWTTVGTAGVAALLYVDDAVVARPATLGHVSYALFAGGVDFVAGDAFGVVTATDAAGVFQTWLGRVYDYALPSAGGSGGGTIADALAT